MPMLSQNAIDLDALKSYISLKEQMLPLDVLGRTLAYNPYAPRLDLEYLKRPKQTPYTLLSLSAHTDLELLLHQLEKATHAHAIMIDFTPLYDQGMPSLAMLDLLGYLRRLSSQPLIHKDFFITPYQLLESVVHGGDGVILKASLPDLKNLCHYATRLGLLAIVEVRTKEELKASILARAQALYLSTNFEDLLKLTPQNLIILKDHDPACADNAYGVDALITTP
ncbi:beta/alpha barrel domain-containing protein [Helicobacter cynogastricus]|uniref:indole-3-glycerol phosphate synthase n=1 Tax=Helicobacter cynogastricus TaxID=329937 RepID=UPI0018F833B1|nr:indole-3-glycerol phosphate synthase [Helicobacter cynogastricus]